nr:TolC family outer membrane protein [Poseidonocella sedimentorum]
MLKKLGQGALLCMAVSVVSAQATAQTLRQAMVQAYENSGLLDQNRALLRAADEDVATSLAALRPILSYSAGVTRSFSESAQNGRSASTSADIGLSASLLLYDGGGSRLGIEVAKESVLATREALRSAEQAVLLGAVRAYMNVRLSREVVALRQSNLRLITQELRAARDRFEVGEVTRTDVALAESRLAASRSQLAAAQGALAQAEAEYTNAVGQRPGALGAVSAASVGAGSVSEAMALARRLHPDLAQARHEIAVSELNVKVAESNLKPTVNLRGSLSQNETFQSDSFSKGGSVGVNLSGPIYSGGQLSSAIRRAIARRDQARASLHVTQKSIDQAVEVAFANLAVVRASRTASSEQVRAAQVAFEGLREEATLGARTTLEVLDAEQELLDARFELASADVDAVINSYEALAAMGRMTVEALDLPVQRYDPTAYYNLVKDGPTAVSKQGKALDRVLKGLGKN